MFKRVGILIIIIVGMLAIVERVEAADTANITITVTLDATSPTTAEVTVPQSTTYEEGEVPDSFEGNAADNSGGSGLDANSTTFYIKDNTKYWDGDSWEDGVTWLATTHSATTGDISAAWTDDNITLPDWTGGHSYDVKAKATDKAGNASEGTAVTFIYSPNTAPILHNGTDENVLPGLTQATDGTGEITITFKIKDAETNACSVVAGSFQYQVDGGDWNNIDDADITGTKTNLASVADLSGTTHTLTWDNSREYIDNAVYSKVRIRFKVTDSTEASAYGLSPDGFDIDNSNLGGTGTITDMVNGKTVEITKDDNTGSGSTVDIPIRGSGDTLGETVDIEIINDGTIFYRGTTTVSATGDWTTDTISWRPGTNTVTVTIDDEASHIFYVDLIDPYGIIYDSLTGEPITGAAVKIYDEEDNLLETYPTLADDPGRYEFFYPPGTYYLRVTVAGYTDLLPGSSIITVPAGNGLGTTPGSVDGSYTDIYYGADFAVVATPLHFDIPLDPEGTALFSLVKSANKKELMTGEVVTYRLTITSNSAVAVADLRINDRIPAGFKYIKGKTLLNGSKVSDPTGNRNLYFNLPTLSADSTTVLRYQLVVGSGVSPGKYSNTAYIERQGGSSELSNRASAEVKVILDPLFDLGTVIGKVFWDLNENGIQDVPRQNSPIITETGIAGVRIVTEDGTVVITDKDGKYHLPGIVPGRHAFRLDESTLPQGAYLTTRKVAIVDVRPGLISKVNFGVNIEGEKSKTQSEKIPVTIIQKREKPRPRLNVALNKEVLEVRNVGGLKEAATFRIFTNYSLFMDRWELEIFDKSTGRLFKRFKGGRQTLTKPIIWNGTNDRGSFVKSGRTYTYFLTVWDRKGKFDKTRKREFSVLRCREEAVSKKEKLEEEIFGRSKEKTDEKDFWLSESKVNNLDLQTMKLEGETVLVHSPQSIVHSIRVMKGGRLEGEISLVQQKGLTLLDREAYPSGLTAKQLLELPQFKAESGSEPIDIIIPNGEYEMQVQSAVIAGPVRKNFSSGAHNDVHKTYTKQIKIGDDYFFFIAMADGEMGYNFITGNTEPVEDDDRFKEGLWLDGKLAYYLKAKIKGKYLITSSLDTRRKQKELFRYIDPDKYYPVYGDSSQLSYQASDTQGILYAMIEWDRSEVMWGDYNVIFSETEFAQFSRTLYGAKARFISTSDTKFGEPHTKLIIFTAEAKQEAAHNEFTGTGGSLYYFRHRYIVEGSDKVRVELRDKITGLVIASLEQKEGSDYTIDYDNGRIIFWRPISQIAESESIISTHLLDGNKLYVVVDYEYYTKNEYDEYSGGVRASQQLGDYLRIGGTYLRDNQESRDDFELKGVDATLRLSENISFDAEYAETKAEQGSSFISTDGGLSFSELSTDQAAKGKAYGVRGEAKLFDKLGISGYYKRIERDFSNPLTIANQGTMKIGGKASLDIFPGTRLSARHDIQELLDNGNLESQAQVGAKKTETTTVQLQSELGEKIEVTAEYRRQKVSGKKTQYEAETNEDADIIAGRLAYKPTDRVRLLVEHQETIRGEKDRQTTVGAEAKVNKYLNLKVAETVGTKGNATTVGASYNVEDKLDFFTNYTLSDSDKGQKRETVVFGGKKKLDNGYELSLGREFSKEGTTIASASTYTVAKKTGERKIEVTFKQQTADNQDEISLTNIFGLSGDINDKVAATFDFEKGKVQNLDGTRTERIAASGGVSYVDKDRIKASSKLEFRYDDTEQDSWQVLSYNAVEAKINEGLTLFGKANISHTENRSTNSGLADFKEIALGVAYRPIYHDRLNLIGKYTFLEDDSPVSQSDFKDIEATRAHVFALEAVYDLTDKFQLVEKGAYKHQDEQVSGFGFTKTQTWLLVNRLNYNLTRDWQIAGEYRVLNVVQAEDLKQGALLEVSKRIGEFIRVGVGYNFTDFSDDLTNLDYTVHGPFARVTGILYDRTLQEVERAKKKVQEENIKKWARGLVHQELARPDSALMKELNNWFYLAQVASDEGRLKQAKELYEKIREAGKKMYEEAEEYIRGRVQLEEKLKSYNELAKIYYKEGRLVEAKEFWQRIITETSH